MTRFTGTAPSRALLAGLACAALAACQSTAPPRKPSAPAPAAKAAAVACVPDAFRWSEPQPRKRLVAASEVVEDTGAVKGEWVTFTQIPVRTVRSSVTASAKVDEKAVITSLHQRMGPETPDLAAPGKIVNPGPVRMLFTGEGAERVAFTGVTVVEASFSYHCAGTGAAASAAPVYGSVVTWHKKVKGSLECGHEPRSRYGWEAYETVCGGGRAP